MDRLDEMRTFVAVVDEDGFSAAARRLKTSRSQASRAVASLETGLGVQLLNRSTRTVSLTESGSVFVDRARTILAEFDDAANAVGELREDLTGRIRINAPMSFGVAYLAPAVADFMKDHPGLKVQVDLNDRFVDPYEEGFDLTLRIGELEASQLKARKIMPIRLTLCASPEYLERHGRPQAPEDLKRHKTLHYGNLSTGTRWRLAGQLPGDAVTIDSNLCSNNGDVLRIAAREGLGIAMLPAFIVSGDLAGGDLVRVLDGFEPAPTALHAVYPPDRFRPMKVRVFVDYLISRFGRGQ